MAQNKATGNVQERPEVAPQTQTEHALEVDVRTLLAA